MLAAIVMLALIPARAQTRPVPAQDPMLDAEIWGFGGIGGPTPQAPSWGGTISPESWLIVPDSHPVEASALLERWLRDPDQAAPTGVKDPTGVDVRAGRWLERWDCDPGQARAAFTSVHLSKPGVWLARLSGAGWMLVNGEPFVGDPNRRGNRGVPVALEAGENRVFVASDGSSFELEFWEPATRLVVEAFDIGWPIGEDLTFPIFNASVETLRSVHVHYGHAVRWNTTCKPVLTDWRDGGYIAPLAMQLGASYYDGMIDACETGIAWDARDVFVPICVWGNEGEVADRRLLRRQADERGRIPNNFDAVPRDVRTFQDSVPGRYPIEAVHVYGTAGTPEETRMALAAARFDQQLCWYYTGRVPLVMSDVDYLSTRDKPVNGWVSATVNDWPLVLRGNADTNAAWPRFVSEDASISAGRGWARWDGQDHLGDSMAGWFPSSNKSPFVLFDTGVDGTRLIGLFMASRRGIGARAALLRWNESPDAGWRQLTTGR